MSEDIKARKIAALKDLAEVFERHGITAWSSEWGSITLGDTGFQSDVDELVMIDLEVCDVSFVDLKLEAEMLESCQ